MNNINNDNENGFGIRRHHQHHDDDDIFGDVTFSSSDNDEDDATKEEEDYFEDIENCINNNNIGCATVKDDIFTLEDITLRDDDNKMNLEHHKNIRTTANIDVEEVVVHDQLPSVEEIKTAQALNKTATKSILQNEELQRKKQFCVLISAILFMIAITIVFFTYMFVVIYKAENNNEGDDQELFDGMAGMTTIPSNNAPVIADFGCWTRRLFQQVHNRIR